MNNFNVRRLTYGGLMTALVFVATAIIPQVPVPFTEGYIHTGDSMIFVAAIMLGWRYGAIAGGLGCAMADLYLTYTHWALPTFIIKSLMGAIVGFMAQEYKDKKINVLRNIVSLAIGGGWIVLGILLKRFMTAKLAGFSDSELVYRLMQKFEFNSIDQLKNLVNYVQISLTIAIIVIPIAIVILSLILHKMDKKLFSINNLMGMTLAGLWMVIGYYIAGGILKGNMLVPIFSIPSNLIQFIGGAAIAFPIIIGLKKTKFFDSINIKL
ncbi:ECF transporter S component [Brassicibacter mesophilus]|uniref:ECF transporter S component n=1 Tax=Brassicibacter mesophilus TaxID=745119 RepID=UPI003D1C06DE